MQFLFEILLIWHVLSFYKSLHAFWCIESGSRVAFVSGHLPFSDNKVISLQVVTSAPWGWKLGGDYFVDVDKGVG